MKHSTQIVAVPTSSVDANNDLLIGQKTHTSACYQMKIISNMPQNGVIFGDGVEEDRLDFNSGAVAMIGLADRTVRLVVPQIDTR